MKRIYKNLSNEWGSKPRKEYSRFKKSTIRKPTKEELADFEDEKEAVDIKKEEE